MKKVLAIVAAAAIALATAAPARAGDFGEELAKAFAHGFGQGLAQSMSRQVIVVQPAPRPIYGQRPPVVRHGPSPQRFCRQVRHLVGWECIRTPRSPCAGYNARYRITMECN